MKIPNTCLIYSFLLDKYMYFNTQEVWEYMGNNTLLNSLYTSDSQPFLEPCTPNIFWKVFKYALYKNIIGFIY